MRRFVVNGTLEIVCNNSNASIKKEQTKLSASESDYSNSDSTILVCENKFDDWEYFWKPLKQVHNYKW